MTPKIIVVLLLSILVPSMAQAGLILPNGKVVFSDEQQQNSDETHKSLTERSPAATEQTDNAGAWEAHFNSEKIDYQEPGT